MSACAPATACAVRTSHLLHVSDVTASRSCSTQTGGKWDLRSVKLHMISKYGHDAVDALFDATQVRRHSGASGAHVCVLTDGRRAAACRGVSSGHHHSRAAVGAKDHDQRQALLRVVRVRQ